MNNKNRCDRVRSVQSSFEILVLENSFNSTRSSKSQVVWALVLFEVGCVSPAASCRRAAVSLEFV